MPLERMEVESGRGATSAIETGMGLELQDFKHEPCSYRLMVS